MLFIGGFRDCLIQKIKEIREELGYSQTDFYENIMSKASYQRFEKTRKNYHYNNYKKFVIKLQCDLKKFYIGPT